MSPTPVLFTVFPELEERIPWVRLIPQPTPTRPLHRLADALDTKRRTLGEAR